MRGNSSEADTLQTSQSIQSPEEMPNFDYTEMNQQLALFLDMFVKI
ncbi:MAG: hypothetical protein AB7D28_00720 [Candidatus Berkiella sp.]